MANIQNPTSNIRFGEVAERLRRSTVQVQQTRGRAQGGGSGIIWSGDGLIITNAHVAHGSHAKVSLWDGSTYDASVLNRDERRDLASLKIPASGLPAATPGNSSALRVGELVIAIGNPFGFIGALTTGVVHSLPGRQRWVAADVRLAPGNSGGPLADAQGRVIGINTMIAGRLALAVPANEVATFLRRDSVSLGVTLREIPHRGLLILEVATDSPAARASLLAGDILVGIDPDELHDEIDRRDVLLLRFTRGGNPAIREVAVRLRVAEAAA